MEFLKHGKQIITEKTMAGNYKQALKLYKTSKKFKTPHKIGYNKIFDTGIIEAKKVYKTFLRNKKLGKVVLIRSHRLSGSGYNPRNFYIKTNEKNSLSKQMMLHHRHHNRPTHQRFRRHRLLESGAPRQPAFPANAPGQATCSLKSDLEITPRRPTEHHALQARARQRHAIQSVVLTLLQGVRL